MLNCCLPMLGNYCGGAGVKPLILRIDTRLPGANIRHYVRSSGGEGITVDWGDGTVGVVGTDIAHDYDEPGEYTIKVYGGRGRSIYFGSPSLLEVVQWGEFEAAGYIAYNATQSLTSPHLTKVPDYLPESVTNMNSMFRGARTFNQDIGGWDVSKGTSFSYMFSDARAFNQDLSGWDTSSATTMYGMFRNAYTFNQDIGAWDTSSVTTMEWMFYGARAFNQDLDNWDVSKVTSFTRMFDNARAFNGSLNGWNTQQARTISFMFNNAYVFNQPIGHFNVSNVTSFFGAFQNAYVFNQDISQWDVKNAKRFSFMFNRAQAFNSDISQWDVSGGDEYYAMFANAHAFNQDISGWDVSGAYVYDINYFRENLVVNYDFKEDFEAIAASDTPEVLSSMAYMLDNAHTFNQDLSRWCVPNIPILPLDFHRVTSAWTPKAGRTPVWGSCPN